MNRCPISYSPCGENRYSEKGLKLLASGLLNLNLLPYTAEEQRIEAFNRASKMSIQGVQPKLSAILNAKNECFEIVDRGGRYILKPQHQLFKEMPENEDLTMRLTEIVIEKILQTIITAIPKWRELIDISFLSPEMKRKYHDLLNTRLATLKLQ